MNGVHDLGGMHGLGLVSPEPNEPVFHETWEGRAFGLYMVTSVFAGYNLDEFRYVCETMEPIDYLEKPYYEHWMFALEELLIKRGFVTREELQERVESLCAAGDR